MQTEMQTQSQVSEVAQPASQPEVSAQPQTTETPSPALEQQAPSAEAAGEALKAAAQPYTPNFKFKVMDKEHEIPEWARAAIKDADTEKQAREIWEKAMGLDVVKPRFQEVREKYKTLEKEYAGIQSQLKDLGGFLQRGDLESFFQTLQIPREMVAQYVLNKIKYEELPPEQKQAIDEQHRLRQQAYELERKNQTLEQSYQQQALQARTAELRSVLDRPDVKQVVQAFDAQEGDGAFMQAVIERGQAAYALKGIDLSPEQAVQEVLKFARYAAQGSMPAQTSAQAQAQPGVAPAAQQPEAQANVRPPTIPSVAGRSTSPAMKQPKSIDDLKKMAEAL